MLGDRRIEFGILLNEFRKQYLKLNMSEFCRITKLCRNQLYHIGDGKKTFITTDLLIFLIDVGFPFHELKSGIAERNISEKLELKRFKKRLNRYKYNKLRKDFNVFCETNKEYIKENYIPNILECFNEKRK